MGDLAQAAACPSAARKANLGWKTTEPSPWLACAFELKDWRPAVEAVGELAVEGSAKEVWCPRGEFCAEYRLPASEPA